MMQPPTAAAAASVPPAQPKPATAAPQAPAQPVQAAPPAPAGPTAEELAEEQRTREIQDPRRVLKGTPVMLDLLDKELREACVALNLGLDPQPRDFAELSGDVMVDASDDLRAQV